MKVAGFRFRVYSLLRRLLLFMVKGVEGLRVHACIFACACAACCGVMPARLGTPLPPWPPLLEIRIQGYGMCSGCKVWE